MKPTKEERAAQRAAQRAEQEAAQEAQLRDLWADLTLTGRTVASKMGISYFILKRLLATHNLAPRSCGRIQGKVAPVVRNEDWIDGLYPGMRTRLGAAPDRVVAQEFGLTRQRVLQIRQELNVPSFGLPQASRHNQGQSSISR